MLLSAEEELVRSNRQQQVMLVNFCNKACADCIGQDSETQGTLQNYGVALHW